LRRRCVPTTLGMPVTLDDPYHVENALAPSAGSNSNLPTPFIAQRVRWFAVALAPSNQACWHAYS
jgi:hypothetical protein